VSQNLLCPACSALPTVDAGAVRCPEGHSYTAIGLAMATTRKTVSALWSAIRALEDDAAGLEYLAQQQPEAHAAARRREAKESRAAAEHLRVHASAAQRRLEALTQDVIGSES
jgi:hypothetical protein